MPTTSNCGGGVNRTLMATDWPFSPSRLLLTPTLTSNSSPGATIAGTFGVMMKLSRTVAAVCALPIFSGVTEIAMTRILPLK